MSRPGGLNVGMQVFFYFILYENWELTELGWENPTYSGWSIFPLVSQSLYNTVSPDADLLCSGTIVLWEAGRQTHTLMGKKILSGECSHSPPLGRGLHWMEYITWKDRSYCEKRKKMPSCSGAIWLLMTTCWARQRVFSLGESVLAP